MEDSNEIMRRTISRLSNDVLLKRWHDGGFNDASLKIAEEEIAKRGLDTSAPAIVRIHAKDARLAAALESRRRSRRIKQVLIALAVLGALAIAWKTFGPQFAA